MLNLILYKSSKSLQSEKVIVFALPISAKKIEINISKCNTFFFLTLKTIQYT